MEKEKRPSLIKRISRKFSGTPKPKLTEEEIEFLVSHTELSREKIEASYKQFLRSHPSAVMDLKSLRSLLKESFPGVELDGLAACIWRIYDTDLDGKISFREFFIALNTMKTGSAEENLRLIYRLFDVNSDGCVEKEELERVAKELSKLGEVTEGTTQRAFIEIDTDMDGCLSLQEFVEAGLQQKVAATSLIVKVIDIFVSE